MVPARRCARAARASPGPGADGRLPRAPRSAGRRIPATHRRPTAPAARLLAAALAAWLVACATTPPPVETGLLFLWEVSRADGRGGVADVLGSVHLGDETPDFDPAILGALAAADTLALEVAPQELEPAAMAKLMAERALLPEGRTLRGVLSRDTWTRLSERLRAAKLDPESFLQVKPWCVALTLQVAELRRQGFASEQGVDLSLARTAAESGKRIVGLESAVAQIDTLDSMPLSTQERLLRETLDEGAPGGAATLSLVLDAWRKGDAARIESVVFQGLGQDPEMQRYFEILYFERNQRMAQAIADGLDAGGRWFVAVGVAHVVGEQGIPRLLARQGYAVRRVPKTPR